MKISFRKEHVFLLTLFLFALGLRLIYLSQLRENPLFNSPIMDAKYHDEWAQSIQKDWLQSTAPFYAGPFFRAPLYGYFLALLYTLFGHGYLAPRIIQFLIGSASVLLIYFLGKKSFGPTVGKVAAVLASLYGTFIYFEGELLIPVLILFLDLVLILAVLTVEEKSGWWRWLGCGVILGLSAIARPNILIFGAVLVPWLMVRLRGRGLSLKKSLVHISGLLLGTVLMILPVTVRNYVVSGEFVPIASQGGVNFFIGNNKRADGVTAIVPGTRATWWGGYHDAIALAEEAEGRPLKASQVSNYWFQRGLEFIQDEPGSYLRLMLKKLALFWSGREIFNNKDIYFVSKRTPVLSVLLWRGPICCPFGIVAPLALAGMMLAWRRREGKRGLMVLFVFSYMVSVILFFVNARYRLPVIPFLLPFAGYTLVSLFRERRLARILPTLSLIMLFGLAVNMNLTGFTGTSLAESYHTQGAGYLQNRMYQQAALEFHRALSINPYYVRSMDGLAQVYHEQNSVDKAINLWEKAVSLEPDNMSMHFHLGIAYHTQGRLDDAIAQWEEAVRLQPDAPRVYLELGNAYEDRGEYEQASGAYQRAIQADPGYVFARCNLAGLYARQGRIDDAVKQYKEAIETQPGFADAYNSLAWLYLQEEANLDEGIQLALKALELDGSVGTYWATLAELYLKKGELDKAREIFRHMITREPQQTYWRRRLEELGG